MLKRQALWVPLVKHNPSFLSAYQRFLVNNPVSTMSMTGILMKPEEIHVALVPDARKPDRQVAALMAFPVTVTAAACDQAYNDGCAGSHTHTQQQQHKEEDCRRELSFGYATTVCDSYNSIHIMECLLPRCNLHVSVNIQSQLLRPVKEGEKLLVVSTLDKLGKRLAYCKTEFFAEAPATAEMVEREKNIKTIAELKAALMYYEKVVSGTHVKAILPEAK